MMNNVSNQQHSAMELIQRLEAKVRARDKAIKALTNLVLKKTFSDGSFWIGMMGGVVVGLVVMGFIWWRVG